MFDLGMQELVVIFVVALLVFGPKRLPELGRTLGKGIDELRKAVTGVKEQIGEEMTEVKGPRIAKEGLDIPGIDKEKGGKEETEQGEEKE